MKRVWRASITSLRMGNAKGILAIFISVGERITDANDVQIRGKETNAFAVRTKDYIGDLA